MAAEFGHAGTIYKKQMAKKIFYKNKKIKGWATEKNQNKQTRQTWTGEGERLYNTNGTPISSSLGISRQKKTERKEASVHVNLEGTGRKRWEEMD